VMERAFEGLQHLDELDGAKDIRVLCRNSDSDLKVLPDVDTKQFLHAREGLLGSQLAKVIHEPLKREG
jgi:hypothetical protein